MGSKYNSFGKMGHLKKLKKKLKEYVNQELWKRKNLKDKQKGGIKWI